MAEVKKKKKPGRKFSEKREFVIEQKGNMVYRREIGQLRPTNMKDLGKLVAAHEKKRNWQYALSVPVELKGAMYDCSNFTQRFMANLVYILENQRGLSLLKFTEEFNKKHEGRANINRMTLYKLRRGDQISAGLFFYFLVAEAVGVPFWKLATMDIEGADYHEAKYSKEKAKEIAHMYEW